MQREASSEAELSTARYNSLYYKGVDIRGLHSDIVNEIRGLALSSHLTFFEVVQKPFLSIKILSSIIPCRAERIPHDHHERI